MGEAIVVGRIGKAHGVRGDVTVDVRTDVPERRFASGERLARSGGGPELVVADARWHSGRLLVRFEGIADRNAAESLRGVVLTIDADRAGDPADPDEPDADGELWWDRDLIGLRALTPDGQLLGEVADVVHTAAGELLAIRKPAGGEHLVPFVRDIVPTVDPPGGRVVVDAPPGLLDLD
ncbi:ribosome maturation factor RimM [Frankia sp. CNm7]|uniref:Ribosome maturation factor RimM n=1 Tax=Frankia nepalensis TaxID=1836974 RepID=A0A937RLM5_9ACTN|nr:ribosome maturation factor RimM [Frankia nepalensis]MBL7497027.1 ribosome maturation factor RimM [Frankia nepalensis]MBL7510505.1 ribosome maturation factor RimM [Frankia nepalensis]MBL7517081.1 ribosome maturation factor RimM [Frankia nepalensis]MBL7628658.1 ribosome maturation factor RimM [Frankia nepalensis]